MVWVVDGVAVAAVAGAVKSAGTQQGVAATGHLFGSATVSFILHV